MLSHKPRDADTFPAYSWSGSRACSRRTCHTRRDRRTWQADGMPTLEAPLRFILLLEGLQPRKIAAPESALPIWLVTRSMIVASCATLALRHELAELLHLIRTIAAEHDLPNTATPSWMHRRSGCVDLVHCTPEKIGLHQSRWNVSVGTILLDLECAEQIINDGLRLLGQPALGDHPATGLPLSSCTPAYAWFSPTQIKKTLSIRRWGEPHQSLPLGVQTGNPIAKTVDERALSFGNTAFEIQLERTLPEIAAPSVV